VEGEILDSVRGDIGEWKGRYWRVEGEVLESGREDIGEWTLESG
jgi:hypothetical protein